MHLVGVVGNSVLILAAIALPIIVIGCRTGRIRVNHIVGIRVPYVSASEEAWRAGHRAATLPVLIGGVVALILDIVGLPLPRETSGVFTALATAALVLGLAVGTFFCESGRPRHTRTGIQEYEHDEG